MKNPSVGALHSPLPSQSEMQGIKTEREIQHEAILHGYAKSLHAMRNHAKSSHAMRNSKGEQLQDKFIQKKSSCKKILEHLLESIV